MKLGLVRIENERLVGVQYFESKWERELGEVLNIEGLKWTVAVIGDSRNEIIEVLNESIAKQNSIVREHNSMVRKQNYQMNKELNREVNEEFNQMMREAVQFVNTL
jgi:hypothetical protein